MSVKVGVRVRPFNSREIELGCKLCVQMVGNTTRLIDVDDPKKNRDFAFDYSFWSHDCFQVDEKGYFVPSSQKYADQRHVYEMVGNQILENAWQGYHCCLFAYGQTGAGKSYSMVGYGTNKGIVPISFSQIFERIKGNTNKDKEYEVSVSMLQIYNEKVQDLLIPVSKRPKQGLKIRQHKGLGVYVQGLSKYVVQSYQAIQAKTDQGNTHRSVAATDMNATSSRAHTIICLQFKQLEQVADKKIQKLSVIYLVDLAGSQKVGKTGAKGQRLKEASGINKSLTVLGMVISDLADKAMGKNKNKVVPYRDSCLTRILQNALGGNSKTLMICAISPANDNYQETLSTLRYADQAKKIQNKAVINQNETDKLIRTLTEENQRIKKYLEKLQSMGLNLEQLDECKSKISINQERMMSKQQKIKHNQAQATPDIDLLKIDEDKAHLLKLNQDFVLSKKIKISLDRQMTRIGKKNQQPPPQILIGNIFIKENHAKIINNEDGISVTPGDSDRAVYVNGQKITETKMLNNHDRIIFGQNSAFVLVIPKAPFELALDQIDYQLAINQIQKKKIKIQQFGWEEASQSDSRVVFDESVNQQQIQKNNQKLFEYEKMFKQQEQEIKKLKKQKQKDSQIQKKKKEEMKASKNIKEKTILQHNLSKILPMVIEVNLIAAEFHKNINFKCKLDHQHGQYYSNSKKDNHKKRPQIIIEVNNKQAGHNNIWSVDKFHNRYYIIKDMLDQFYKTSVVPAVTADSDPFWDPPQPILIGECYYSLSGLPYLLDNPQKLQIIIESANCGTLDINIYPANDKGQNLSELIDTDQVYENNTQDQYQLVGKDLNLIVEAKSVHLKGNYKNVSIQYKLKNLVDDDSFDSISLESSGVSQKDPHLHLFQEIRQTISDSAAGQLALDKKVSKLQSKRKLHAIFNVTQQHIDVMLNNSVNNLLAYNQNLWLRRQQVKREIANQRHPNAQAVKDYYTYNSDCDHQQASIECSQINCLVQKYINQAQTDIESSCCQQQQLERGQEQIEQVKRKRERERERKRKRLQYLLIDYLMRQLKEHQRRLLRKVNMHDWKSERQHRRNSLIQAYALHDQEDYKRYSRLVGQITSLISKLKHLPPDDIFRVKIVEQLLNKLFQAGLISNNNSVQEVQKLSVSAFCKRRLATVLKSLKFTQSVKQAVKYIQQGQVRVGSDIQTDPAFLVPRHMQDHIGWTSQSAIKRKIEAYKDQLDDYDLLQ